MNRSTTPRFWRPISLFISIYGIVQFLQWISYTAIFRIFLVGAHSNHIFVPLYIALLAFTRGGASLLFANRTVLRRRGTYFGVLIGGAILSICQIFCLHNALILIFVIATAVKLGALTLFQVWRDALSARLSGAGISKSHRLNGVISIIDYASLGFGALSGGILTDHFGTQSVFFGELIAFILSFALLRFIPAYFFSKSVGERDLKKTPGLRPLGLASHALRAVSDAGFQGIIPIVAYQQVKLTSSLFGMTVSASGILIAFGARLAMAYNGSQSRGRKRYVSIAAASNVLNAFFLWLCFQSNSLSPFLIWLAVGSLFCGLAMVATRTIVLAETHRTDRVLRFDSPMLFTAVRWFSLGIGSLFFAYGLGYLALETLKLIFLLAMAASGFLLQMSAYEGSGAPYLIGKRISELLKLTFMILAISSVGASYVILIHTPRELQQKTQTVALMPFVALTAMNMRISDLSEEIRLIRTFQFPEGTLHASLRSSENDRPLFEEVFSDQGWRNIEKMRRPVAERIDSRTRYRVYPTGLFSRAIEYEFDLENVGPDGQSISAAVAIEDSKQSMKQIQDFIFAMGISLTFLGALYFALRHLVAKIFRPLSDVASRLEKTMIDEGQMLCSRAIAGQSLEVQRVVMGYNGLLEKNEELHEHLKGLYAEAKLGELAAQVAHDIHSPLAALEVISERLFQLPEHERVLVRSAIRRIKDITNGLMAKTVSRGILVDSATSTSPETATSQLLFSLMDEVVSEKRLQYRSRPGVKIELRMSGSSYGLFASIVAPEMKRIISNLINNAVDAIGSSGHVTIEGGRSQDGKNIFILVRDTGKGISPELLPKLMQKGETHGKTAGSGLGLYHARTTIESWGGSIRLEAALGFGTTVHIRVPISEAPSWFVPSLTLVKHSSVVVLDDDPSIHHAWQARFENVETEKFHIKIRHFSTLEDLRAWWITCGSSETCIFLVDYELIGQKYSGVDLIEELGIAANSILVTSRYEESDIRERCQQLRIRLIPKGMVGFVPVVLADSAQIPDAVLIDDQELIRLAWKIAAEHYGKNLSVFETPEQFFAVKGQIPLETPVYVDVCLANEIDGRVVSKEIYEAGFRTLYLATGMPVEALEPMSWLTGIVGKMPPW